MDLWELGDDDVKLLISEWCSEFGAVDEVHICRFVEPRAYGIAVIGMASADDAMDVVDALGGVEYGSLVVLPLEMAVTRRTRLIPSH